MLHRWRVDENGEIDPCVFQVEIHTYAVCDACGEMLCTICHPDFKEMGNCPGEIPDDEDW